MMIIAVLFLVLMFARGVFWLMDDGFAGPVFTGMHWLDMGIRFVGTLLAVFVVYGINMEVTFK